jgi:hypothetical protein
VPNVRPERANVGAFVYRMSENFKRLYGKAICITLPSVVIGSLRCPRQREPRGQNQEFRRSPVRDEHWAPRAKSNSKSQRNYCHTPGKSNITCKQSQRPHPYVKGCATRQSAQGQGKGRFPASDCAAGYPSAANRLGMTSKAKAEAKSKGEG